MSSKSVTAAITAENTWTDPLTLRFNQTCSVSISGAFSAVVTIQRRLDGTNWRDVPNPDDSFGINGPFEGSYQADDDTELRIGVKTGDFTSGTVACRLGRG